MTDVELGMLILMTANLAFEFNICMRDDKQPLAPPYNLNAPDRAQMRGAENREAIWKAYAEMVAYAAANLDVVTSGDIVKMAETTPN